MKHSVKNRTIFDASLLTCTTILVTASGAYAADNTAVSQGYHVVDSKTSPAPTAIPGSYPAVSAPNVTFDVGGGIMDSHGAGTLSAIGAVPVKDNYGVQLDTMYKRDGSVDAGGVAGHAFYRDPQSYLLGVTSLWYDTDGYDIFRYGVESEFYVNRLTFAPSVGFQHGAANRGNVAYYDTDLSYYFTDNFKLKLNATGFKGVNGGSGEFEWQPHEECPLTVYLNTGDSNINKTYALIGLRYSIGAGNSSLMHRDRYSDPKNILNPLDRTLGNSVANKTTPVPHTTPAPSPSPSPSPSPI